MNNLAVKGLMDFSQEWSLPNEAITIHQDFDEDRATSPGPLSAPATLVPESPSSATEIEPVLLQHEVIQQHSMASIISTETFVATLPQWHVTSLVSSMLQHYADKVRKVTTRHLPNVVLNLGSTIANIERDNPMLL